MALSEAPASPAIKEGGSIVVGLPGDMVLADPSLVSDSNSSYIHLNVIEGLLGAVELVPADQRDAEAGVERGVEVQAGAKRDA